MPIHFQTTYTRGTGSTAQASLTIQVSTLKARLVQYETESKNKDMHIESQDTQIRMLQQLSHTKDQDIDELATANEMKDEKIEGMSKSQERKIEIRDEHIKCLLKRIEDVDRSYGRTREHRLQQELVHARMTINNYEDHVKQLESVLTKVQNEKNIDSGFTTSTPI
jgi:chromosome segregation ATPase